MLASELTLRKREQFGMRRPWDRGRLARITALSVAFDAMRAGRPRSQGRRSRVTGLTLSSRSPRISRNLRRATHESQLEIHALNGKRFRACAFLRLGTE